MSPRERVVTALACRQPDQVPINLAFTPSLYEVFRRETGATDPAEYFDLETRRLGIRPTRCRTDFTPWLGELPEGSSVSEWGVGEVRGSLFHFTDYVHPLTKACTPHEVHDYPWPDILADYRWDDFADRVRKTQGRGYAVSAGMEEFFETAWALRGLENMLCDMAQDPDMATALLDGVGHIFLEYNRRVAEAGVDVMRLGDDVGTQRGMMISVEMFRRWLKPWYARAAETARMIKPDIHIFYHSDGDIRPILDDLVEAGINVLEPVQPECMAPEWVKQEYGDHLALWGTVGTQTTMPFGSPDEVRRVVRERIETVGRGGGLLLAPTHVLEPDVPWDNVVAFAQAARAYGKY